MKCPAVFVGFVFSDKSSNPPKNVLIDKHQNPQYNTQDDNTGSA